nr:ABC transporter G family member 11-like [Tanacetum cinerariifolium]
MGNIHVEQVINVLVESYKSSEIYMQVQGEIAAICQQKGDLVEKKGSLQASFITQCLVLAERSSKNMYRDVGYYWLRLFIYIALGIAVGTIFYDLGSGFSSLNARISVLKFISAFLTILAIGGFPSFVEEIKVFQGERLNGHYGVGSYVISHAMSSTPYLLIISLVPGVLSTIIPNLLMGIISGAGIQGLMILSAGFFRLPNDLSKVFWKYPMYYISFHKYAVQGMYKNEFEVLMFPRYSGGPPMIDGETILESILQVEMGYSKWIDLGILFGMVFVYRGMLFCTIKITERVKPVIRAFLLSSCA